MTAVRRRYNYFSIKKSVPSTAIDISFLGYFKCRSFFEPTCLLCLPQAVHDMYVINLNYKCALKNITKVSFKKGRRSRGSILSQEKFAIKKINNFSTVDIMPVE